MTAPRHYFPVHRPHWMPGPQPRLGTPGVGDRRVEIDETSADYRAAKRRILGANGRGPFRVPSGTAEFVACAALRAAVAAEYPALGAEITALSSLDEVVGAIPEDVVLMRRAAGADAAGAIAVYLNVCFPTGWCPACAVGQDFLRIHAPVPAADRFGATRGNLAANLFGSARRTTVRFVWTLTPDDALDRCHCAAGHHDGAPCTPWSEATAAFFRVERQVVWPLDETLSVFLIRIYRRDVRALTPPERAEIRESVATMDPRVRAYKGFAGFEATIARLLDDA